MKRVKWVLFSSPAKLLRAYWTLIARENGCKASDIVITGDMLAAIRRQRMWAFVSVKTKIPVVRYWHEPDVDRGDLAMMLGHELGHATGKPRRGHAEEDRADEYGLVAEAVWRRISGRAR